MRILIAGSSGYLGSALTKALTDHEVVRLVRRAPRREDEIQWDPYREPLDPAVLDGADAVVNLGGAPIAGRRWNQAYKKRIQTSRMVPTKVLAVAVAAAKVPVLMNASAVGWYGDRADVAVDETTPAAADFRGSICHAWESATAPAAAGGARVVKLRTGHVLGPGSPLLAKFVPPFKLCIGGPFGGGRQYMPWISLRDWVGATVMLLTADTAGPVNLVGPTEATNREFTRSLSAVLHRPAPWPIPGWAVKLVAGEVAEELLQSTRVQPTVLKSKGFEYADTTVLDALHWALRPAPGDRAG